MMMMMSEVDVDMKIIEHNCLFRLMPVSHIHYRSSLGSPKPLGCLSLNLKRVDFS